MKKIIAAALSILLGAFGYTVVDKTIEDRVATLESEVVELREIASIYHTPISSSTTTTSSTTSNTYSEEYTTTNANSTTKQTTSTTSYTTFGYSLNEDKNSRTKFLLRKFSNGKVLYISPESLNNKVTTTRAPHTTDALSYEEYFLSVSNSSFIVTGIRNEVSYSYWYDKNYNLFSSPQTKTFYDLEIRCTGNTDSSLNGYSIDFDFTIFIPYGNDFHYDSLYSKDIVKKNIVSNKINPDGSFEYVCKLTFKTAIREDFRYSLDSISVNKPNSQSTTQQPTTTAHISTTAEPSTTLREDYFLH